MPGNTLQKNLSHWSYVYTSLKHKSTVITCTISLFEMYLRKAWTTKLTQSSSTVLRCVLHLGLKLLGPNQVTQEVCLAKTASWTECKLQMQASEVGLAVRSWQSWQQLLTHRPGNVVEFCIFIWFFGKLKYEYSPMQMGNYKIICFWRVSLILRETMCILAYEVPAYNNSNETSSKTPQWHKVIQ